MFIWKEKIQNLIKFVSTQPKSHHNLLELKGYDLLFIKLRVWINWKNFGKKKKGIFRQFL